VPEWLFEEYGPKVSSHGRYNARKKATVTVFEIPARSGWIAAGLRVSLMTYSDVRKSSKFPHFPA
jgi:hypothetical protein